MNTSYPTRGINRWFLEHDWIPVSKREGESYPASPCAVAISSISRLTAKSCWRLKSFPTILTRFCRRFFPEKYSFAGLGRIDLSRNEVSNGEDSLDLVLGSDAGSVVLPPARHRREWVMLLHTNYYTQGSFPYNENSLLLLLLYVYHNTV